MSIFQIVYISAQTVEFSEQDLRELLAGARNNNHALDISGMLLYHQGSFIQVLEGDEQAVEALFDKIALDKRHSNTTVILKGFVEERTFSDWAMGFVSTKSLSDIPEGFHPFLQSGFSSVADGEDAVRSALLAFREGRWRASAD